MTKQRGRPPLKPTATQRQRVRIAAGAGVPHFEIAAALGISQPSLRKHFAAELHEGAALARVEELGDELGTVSGEKDQRGGASRFQRVALLHGSRQRFMV